MVKVTQHVRNKLDPFWKGPYKVIRRNGPVTYELELKPGERMHSTVHQQYLRPWNTSEEPDEEAEPEASEKTAPETPRNLRPRRGAVPKATPTGATGEGEQTPDRPLTRSERKRLGLPLESEKEHD
jgi:hypothetical protein